MKQILEDEREITALYYNSPEQEMWRVQDGFEIVAYGEPGPYAMLPYFAVKKDGIIIARIPATMVEVQYKQD